MGDLSVIITKKNMLVVSLHTLCMMSVFPSMIFYGVVVRSSASFN